MYLFSKKQIRSFDVEGRPWSRYIDVYQSMTQADEAAALGGEAGTFLSTPGINVFTRPVNVTPGLSTLLTVPLYLTGVDCRVKLGITSMRVRLNL